MTFALSAQPEQDHDTPVPFPLWRSAGTLVGSAMFPAGLISVGLHLLGQPVFAQVNLIAAAICGVGGVIGLLPVWFLSKQHRHGAAQGFMAGMLLRVLICAAAYFALQWGGYAHAGVLLYFLAGWYLATLLVEVKLISSFLLAHAVAPTPAPGTTSGNTPGGAAVHRNPELAPSASEGDV